MISRVYLVAVPGARSKEFEAVRRAMLDSMQRRVVGQSGCDGPEHELGMEFEQSVDKGRIGCFVGLFLDRDFALLEDQLSHALDVALDDRSHGFQAVHLVVQLIHTMQVIIAVILQEHLASAGGITQESNAVVGD